MSSRKICGKLSFGCGSTTSTPSLSALLPKISVLVLLLVLDRHTHTFNMLGTP